MQHPGETNRPICTHSSSTRRLHLTSTANLHFQKTSILLKTFGLPSYFGGNLLQIVFEDMEKGWTVLQQGQ